MNFIQSVKRYLESTEPQMSKVIRQLGKAKLTCNHALASKLWKRFSEDQCATWIQIDDESVERFVEWLKSDLDPNKAWS